MAFFHAANSLLKLVLLLPRGSEPMVVCLKGPNCGFGKFSFLKDWSARIKFVDDTTVLEVVPRCSPSLLPILVNEIAHFASSRGMELNCKKCKEMVISFLQYRLPQEYPIYIDGVLVHTVSSFKLLGVMLRSDLSWSDQAERHQKNEF